LLASNAAVEALVEKMSQSQEGQQNNCNNISHSKIQKYIVLSTRNSSADEIENVNL